MSDYFNIKYVSEGPYFNVKGGTPPTPTLPTVTYLSTVYGLTSSASIASGGTSSPLKAYVEGTYDGDYFEKDNSKQYAFFRYNNGVGYKDAGGIFEVAWSQDNYLCAKNITDSTQNFKAVRIAECSSADAQVVTVYDITYGDASYAFKFNLSGTYYYSVLDSMLHPGDWTNDLSSIGYSLTPPVVLPTVTIYATPSTYCAFNSSGSSVTINAGNSQNMVYYWTGNQYSAIIYDSTKLYSLVSYRNSGTFIGRTGLSCFKYHNPISPSNYLGVANVSSQSITVDAFDYATCSDSTATVVTVYDSNNVAYNAFKFTTNNTDYYYVLDGTQTDWTDDLSSIGYSELVTSYFRQDKDWQTLQTYNNLYDDNGNRISYQAGKTYTLQTLIGTGNYLLNTDGWLQFHFNGTTSTSAKFVKYTVS